MKARIWILLALTAAALALIGYRDEVATELGGWQRHLAATGRTDPAQAAPAPIASGVADDGVYAPTAEGIANASTAPADASAPATTVPAKPVRALKLSAAEARTAMRERWRDQDCQAAQRQSAPTAFKWRELQDWRWLPQELAAAERQAMAEAAARLTAGCPAPITDKAELRRRGDEAQALLAAAQAAGDLYARLELSSASRDIAALSAQARAVLYDAVLSGDPEAIARLWRVEYLARRGQSLDFTGQFVDFNLWPLVACDLGLDCGPGSRALDRACLELGNGCGYPSLDALVRDRSPSWQYNLTDQRRRELVERIRSGQIAGMFDPAMPQPPDDG
jgi:hypothetical protein